MKKYILVTIVCAFVLNIILTIISFMKMIPDKPVIKHGEFPFCLTYEANGDIYEVKDTLLCDYDGFEANAAQGVYRRWKSYLKSGNKRIILFKNSNIEIFFSPNINSQKTGAYYMGDHEICDRINISFPNAWYTYDYENKQVNSYIISSDELWEMYKIKLLSWNISPPINNTFK